ncbi:hypothetical protein L3Q82_006672 [Scortum barcoo]|uniref:Uncharacterized protein n=1 Tax=Scortum barcoo TaxID=214431 RepID=A0ACB8X347_9TELE|nr:hypothetical protein L3Q82_006672 [Scortum barcoo]
MVPAQTVLVTGATGLLGRSVCREFQNSGWLVIGTGYRRARPRLLRCDLTDEDAIRGLLQEYKPDVIIHCAAERRPDVVERHTEAAVNLNVHATSTLAKEAGADSGPAALLQSCPALLVCWPVSWYLLRDLQTSCDRRVEELDYLYSLSGLQPFLEVVLMFPLQLTCRHFDLNPNSHLRSLPPLHQHRLRHVFDGRNPPYGEDDYSPNPLNAFTDGANWRERERHYDTVQVPVCLLSVSHLSLSPVCLSPVCLTRLSLSRLSLPAMCLSGAAVLRVPVLFGEVESVSESAVTSLWLKVQGATESCTLDHCQQRFPTHTRDVAAVCRKLCERARQDPSIRGIFHFSAKEQMTKYEMAVAIAQAFSLPSNHLIPLTEQPAASTLRPINSQLNCSRLELLNLSVEPRPFTSAISDCLWPFTPDKRWRQTVSDISPPVSMETRGHLQFDIFLLRMQKTQRFICKQVSEVTARKLSK